MPPDPASYVSTVLACVAVDVFVSSSAVVSSVLEIHRHRRRTRQGGREQQRFRHQLVVSVYVDKRAGRQADGKTAHVGVTVPQVQCPPYRRFLRRLE